MLSVFSPDMTFFEEGCYVIKHDEGHFLEDDILAYERVTDKQVVTRTGGLQTQKVTFL